MAAMNEIMRNAVIASWRERWHVMTEPAPGIRAAVAAMWMPKRSAVREETVKWLLLGEDGFIRLGIAEGDNAMSVEEAAKNMLPVPMFCDASPKTVIPLSTPQSVLPFAPVEGVVFNPSNLTREISLLLRTEGQAMYSAFRALLDQRVLEVAAGSTRKTTGLPTANLYNTYAGASRDGTETRAEWRQQVGERWPVLSPYVMNNPDVVRACDTGESVPLVLSRVTGLKPATLKSFAGHPFGTTPQGKPVHGKNIDITLRLADAVIPGHLPRNSDEWVACKHLAAFLHPYIFAWSSFNSGLYLKVKPAGPGMAEDYDRTSAEKIQLLTQDYIQDILRRSGKPWTNGITGNGQAHRGIEEPEQQRRNDGRNHFTDAARALYSEVIAHLPQEIRPAFQLYGESSAIAGTAILHGRSLHSALMVSSRHFNWLNLPHRIAAAQAHADGFNEEGAVQGDTDSNSWEAVAPDAEFNGHAVVNLTSAQALTVEGGVMNHCVSQYSHMCAAGVGSILSIRAANGSRSTAEIRLARKKNGRKYEVNQHRGIRNAPPARECEKVLADYLEAAEEGNLFSVSRMKFMHEFHERVPVRNAGYGYYEYGQNGHPAMTPQQIEDAWRRWKGWLGTDAPDARSWFRTIPVFRTGALVYKGSCL